MIVRASAKSRPKQNCEQMAKQLNGEFAKDDFKLTDKRLADIRVRAKDLREKR